MSYLQKLDIAVIIPALNEIDNLRWLLPLLIDKYRVIVVDNGSSDGTALVAHDLGAEVLQCGQRGYGAAVGTAFARLTSETNQIKIAVVFDADGTSPAECIPLVCRAIETGRADLVLAQRSSLERGAMPPHARFGNWLATWLIYRFSGFRFTDMGPLRALRFSRIAEMQMHDTTWGWNVEMQIKAVLLGLRIDQIDINYRKRRYGKSKISGSIIGSIRAGFKILSGVVVYNLEARTIRSAGIKSKSISETQAQR